MGHNKVLRSVPYMRVLLLLNLGAFLALVLRLYVLPSTTRHQADLEVAGATAHRIQQQSTPCNCSRTNDSLASELKVPNIVHYIWYNTEVSPLRFHHLLSILSSHKILKPDVIYFHTDRPPNGPYWEQAKRLPNFKVNIRQPPTELFGETVKAPMFYTSHSNVDRIKILMEYGGIYMDFDTLIIRPLDDLRQYDCVIGLEQPTQACGSIIICHKDALFLTMWLNSYLDDYRIDIWAYNTGKVPANLARRFPHLVHVEETKLNRPNFAELDKIWGPTQFRWQDNYALHTWYRIWHDMSPYYDGVEPDPETIKTMNHTFGEMARTIYYGKKDLIPRSTI